MTYRKWIFEANYDSNFEIAASGRPAQLRLIMDVTLVPLDPSALWARSKQAVPLPAGMSASTIPPAHLAHSMESVRRGNVVDANSTPVRCRSWLASEWVEFTKRFKQSVEHAWNNQMVFLPIGEGPPDDSLSDKDYRSLISSPKVHAHVTGALEINLLPMNQIGHAVIEVAHLEEPNTDFRDRMNRITDESVQFTRSKFTYGASRGITGRTGQIAAAHEIGHWLRNPNDRVFDHIDRAYANTLPTQLQDKAQYGKTLGRYYSLMGGGSLASVHEARPWLTRLRRQSTLKTGWGYIHRIHFDKIRNEIPPRQQELMGA